MALHAVCGARLLALVLCFQGAVGDVKLGKGIVKLTEEKFEHYLKSGESMLVEFFAPWCHACESFSPAYRKTAQALREQSVRVKVAAVDCDAETQLADRLKIQSFPTIMFFSKERETPAKWKSDSVPGSDELVEWVSRLAKPAVEEAVNDEAIPMPAPGAPPVVVLRAGEVSKVFTTFAMKYQHFGRCFWRKASGEAVVELRHYKEPVQVLPWADAEGSRLEQFTREHVVPRFFPASTPPAVLKELANSGHGEDVAIVWVLVNATGATPAPEAGAVGPGSCTAGAAGHGSQESSCSAEGSPDSPDTVASRDGAAVAALDESVQEWRSMMIETASILRSSDRPTGIKGKYAFVYADAHRWQDWAEKTHYAWGFPQLVLQSYAASKPYFFEDFQVAREAGIKMPRSSPELLGFIEAAARHKVKQRPKSQRPPEAAESTEGPWKILVGTTIEKELNAAAATLLYVMKDKSTQHGDFVQKAEIEAFHDLAAWVKESCEMPPAVAIFDAGRNEIPMSLYMVGSFSPLELPGLFFVPRDTRKIQEHAWGAAIAKYPRDSSKGVVLSDDLEAAAKWALKQAAGVEGLTVPEQLDTLSYERLSLWASVSVPEIEEADFDSFLAATEWAFVDFYAPWCSSCKRFEPIFEAAARSARTNATGLAEVVFAKVNADEAAAIVLKHRVEKYPTIILFRNGAKHSYTEGRDRDSLLSWLEAAQRPTVTIVESRPQAEPSDGMQTILWTGPLEPTAGWSSMQQHAAAAAAAPELSAYHRLAAAWKATHQNVRFFAMDGSSPPRVELFAPSTGDGGSVEARPYLGELDEVSLTLWLASELVRSEPVPKEQLGAVVKVVGRTFGDHVLEPRSAVLLEVYAPGCGYCKKLEPVYRKFAEQMKRERRDLVVANMDGTKNGIPFEGYNVSGYPRVFFIPAGGSDAEVVTARTLADLVRFVDRQGVSVAPAVTEITERDFVTDVLRANKHVLLELYNPTCPHCQRFEPVYQKFAEDLVEERNDIVVMKMDATSNPINFGSDELVKGVPTVLCFRRGEQQPQLVSTGVVDVKVLRRFTARL